MRKSPLFPDVSHLGQRTASLTVAGRMATRMDKNASHMRLQAALESQMRAQSQGTGLRMLRQIMARRVKGEKGLRMEVWKTAAEDEKRAAGLHWLQRSLEALPPPPWWPTPLTLVDRRMR